MKPVEVQTERHLITSLIARSRRETISEQTAYGSRENAICLKTHELWTNALPACPGNTGRRQPFRTHG